MRAKAMGRLSFALWNMKERPYFTMMGQVTEFGVTERRQIGRLEKAGTCLEGVFLRCLWEWDKHLPYRYCLQPRHFC